MKKKERYRSLGNVHIECLFAIKSFVEALS